MNQARLGVPQAANAVILRGPLLAVGAVYLCFHLNGSLNPPAPSLPMPVEPTMTVDVPNPR